MKSAKNIKQSIKKLTVESSDQIHDRVLQKVLRKLDQSKRQATLVHANTWRMILKSEIGKVAAAFLVICSLTVCFVLSKKVTSMYRKVISLKSELEQVQRETTSVADNTATINLYLREHKDAVARHASASAVAMQPAQMHVSRHDILYYESFDDGSEYVQPSIIVRGTPAQREINLLDAPTISNGHTLTISEARKTADFKLRAPPRLHPGYSLDQIRRIEGRDAIQLLYTDGINSVSLFEQPLDGQRGLSPQDFREYAVYRNKGQASGTILAWRGDALSYVLIGNVEMSQLMDMARSISVVK